MTEEEVADSREYSARAADDYVVTRRWDQFPSHDRAAAWGRMKWGERLREVVAHPEVDMWVFIIRKSGRGK